MEQVRFTIGGAIKFGWNKMKEQWKFLVGFALIIAIYEIMNGFIQSAIQDQGSPFLFFFVYMIISIVIGLVLQLWQIRIALDVVDGKQAQFDSLQAVLPMVWSAFLTLILVTVIVGIGFLLLIIPGIIWSIKYQYAIYFIIDKQMTPFEALEASGKITKGEKWHLLGFGIVLALVALAGFLCLGIGILVAFPVIVIASGYVFRELQKGTMMETKLPA